MKHSRLRFLSGCVWLILAAAVYYSADSLFNSRMNEDVADLVTKLQDSGLTAKQANAFRGTLLLMKGTIHSYVTFMLESVLFLIVGIYFILGNINFLKRSE